MSDSSVPETTPGSSAGARRGMPHARPVQHARLLVVTPDTEQANTLRARLAPTGYSVDWAPNAALALAAVQAQAPELALVAALHGDESHGETTSFLVQALKAASDKTYLPILLLTTAQAEEGEDWAANGADDALGPGASAALLRLRVGALLQWKRRHQALADSVLETQATCLAAQQAAGRYEAVFMQNMEAMLLAGTNGNIAEANGCACALIGCEPHALCGQPLARLCPPELLWATELTRQGAVRSFSDPDASLVTAAGEIVPIEVRSAPIEPGFQPNADAASSADAPGLFVVTLRDRRPERARLAHAQREAAAETVIVFRREISNPLFVIAGNIELLQSALGQANSDVQAKLGRIADAGRRLVQAAARASAPPAAPPPQD